MEVEIKEVRAVGSPEDGTWFQNIPEKTRTSEEVATSTEAGHFCSQRHTKVEKPEQATRVSEWRS